MEVLLRPSVFVFIVQLPCFLFLSGLIKALSRLAYMKALKRPPHFVLSILLSFVFWGSPRGEPVSLPS